MRQKGAALKDLRNINRVLNEVEDKDNKVVFGRVSDKEDIYVIRFYYASNH